MQGVRDDVTALDSKVDDKADEANVQSLADAVNGRLDDLEESKAEKASVYTKGEVTGLLDALELDPATSANSPDCVTAEVGGWLGTNRRGQGNKERTSSATATRGCAAGRRCVQPWSAALTPLSFPLSFACPTFTDWQDAAEPGDGDG